MPILDKYGRPVRSVTVPRRPLPSSQINKSHRDYVSVGLTPEKIGPIFRKADQGDLSKQAELFEQLLEKDGHLLSEYTKRVNAINSQYLDWQITPASDSQRDLDVVDFIGRYVLNHDDWAKYKVAQQSAIGYGYAPLEPEWDKSEGQWVVRNFQFRAHKELTYTDPKTGYLTDWPFLVTDEHPEGVEVHPRALFIHKGGGLVGHASRIGVFRPVTWMIVFKHFAVKDWWTFSELCGIPLRVGYYDAGASDEDRATLERGLRDLGVDMYALLSKGTEIEFKEAAARVSGADLWKEQTAFCNNEVSKAVIGSAAFAEAGKSGSYALHTLETGVRADLTLSDAQASASTDLDQWIAPLVGLNFGWDTELPRFEAIFKKQDDLKVKSEWLEPVVSRIGDNIPLAWYLEQYGIPALQDGDRTVGQVGRVDDTGVSPEPAKLLMAKQTGRNVAVLAAQEAQEAIDGLVDAAVGKVELRGNERRILALIEGASSYEEVFAGLAELYPDMDISGLEKTIKDALLMAEAMGVSKVEGTLPS